MLIEFLSAIRDAHIKNEEFHIFPQEINEEQRTLFANEIDEAIHVLIKNGVGNKNEFMKFNPPIDITEIIEGPRKTADEIIYVLDSLISFQPEDLQINTKKIGDVILMSYVDFETLKKEYPDYINDFRGYKVMPHENFTRNRFIITSPKHI